MSDKLAEHSQVASTASFNGVQKTGDSSSQLFHSMITLKMHGVASKTLFAMAVYHVLCML